MKLCPAVENWLACHRLLAGCVALEKGSGSVVVGGVAYKCVARAAAPDIEAKILHAVAALPKRPYKGNRLHKPGTRSCYCSWRSTARPSCRPKRLRIQYGCALCTLTTPYPRL